MGGEERWITFDSGTIQYCADNRASAQESTVKEKGG